jgi:hypothetical protein
MSDIFVSYASEDLDRIRPLIGVLEDTKWSVFWDRTIPAGRTWRQFIGRELDICKCMLVVWSTHSIDSDWVQEEADEGKRRGVLVPVLIDEISPPIGFRSIQAAKLVAWDGKSPSSALDRLLMDLASLLGPLPAQLEKEKEEARKREEQVAKHKTQEDAVQRARIIEAETATAKRMHREQQAQRKPQVEVAQRARIATEKETEAKRQQQEQEGRRRAKERPAAEADIERYGIARVPVDYFDTGGYRYTKLEDAVAQARRDHFPHKLNSKPSPEDTAELARLGIMHVRIDHYDFGGHRYTSLEDAVAAAKCSG